MTRRISYRKWANEKALLSFMVAILALIFSGCSVSAIEPINTNSEGVALKGYDPVAYFTDNRPIRGSEKFEYEWMDAKWRFSSEAHLRLFEQDPEKYAPQYGGY